MIAGHVAHEKMLQRIVRGEVVGIGIMVMPSGTFVALQGCVWVFLSQALCAWLLCWSICHGYALFVRGCRAYFLKHASHAWTKAFHVNVVVGQKFVY